MENNFVPYELVLALNKLGCKLFINYVVQDEQDPYPTIEKGILWQQAFDWFREKHGLLYSIDWSWINREKETIFWDYIIMFSLNKYLIEGRYILESKEITKYTTYEEARLECLKKLIEIVKEK